jgi:hypothetical protein
MSNVMPSGLLSAEKRSTMSTFNKKYKNTPLRMGCVTKIYEIDDENNNSKNDKNSAIVQYDVMVEQITEDGKGTNFVKYDRCMRMTGFGGLADFFEYKLRDSEVDFEETYSFTQQDGSMVILLCLDGFSEMGIIIGSVKHYDRPTTLDKKAGLHLEGEYNGLNWKINKDGELVVTFKSKTNNKGEPQDETAGGTHFQIDKEGSVDINANLEGDEETYMRMDKKNKDVGLKAGANVGFTAKKDVAMNADGKITGKAKGAVEFTAEGAAKVSAKSSLDLEGESAVNVKGGNVIISGQNGVIIEGQQCMIDTQKVFVGQGGTPAVIATTKFVGQGNHGAPVNCSAVGPFSSSVFIAS